MVYSIDIINGYILRLHAIVTFNNYIQWLHSMVTFYGYCLSLQIEQASLDLASIYPHYFCQIVVTWVKKM